MALIYQPSKRIFCGWFEPLKSTTYSEYPKFFDWLRANGFIYKQGTQAMQFSINKGLMVTRFHSFTHSDGEKDQKTHAHVTGKGIFYFYRRLLQEGLIARNPNLELTA